MNGGNLGGEVEVDETYIGGNISPEFVKISYAFAIILEIILHGAPSRGTSAQVQPVCAEWVRWATCRA